MNPDQSLAIMKALADQSRLAIVNSLLERSQYVEELASRHGLAPSTSRFTEQLNSRAGQQRKEHTIHDLRKEAIFARRFGRSSQPRREAVNFRSRIDEYRARLWIRSFARPARQAAPSTRNALIVLEQFAQRFSREIRYDEQEVPGAHRPLHDDYCIIRRLLVDEGLLRREGGQYWRDAATAAAGALPLPASNGAMPPEKPMEARRREIKREIKAKVPDMGVYRITNTINGKIYVGSSKNRRDPSSSCSAPYGEGSFQHCAAQELNEWALLHSNFRCCRFSTVLIGRKPGPVTGSARTALAAATAAVRRQGVQQRTGLPAEYGTAGTERMGAGCQLNPWGQTSPEMAGY